MPRICPNRSVSMCVCMCVLMHGACVDVSFVCECVLQNRRSIVALRSIPAAVRLYGNAIPSARLQHRERARTNTRKHTHIHTCTQSTPSCRGRTSSGGSGQELTGSGGGAVASARAHEERTDQRSNPVESKARSLLTGAETPKGPNLPRRGEFFLIISI